MDEVLVFHGGPLWPGNHITYFTDNFRVASSYGDEVWIGYLDISGDPVVVDHGQHASLHKWATHAAHCNAHREGEVLVSLNVWDYAGMEPPYRDELISNVYSTDDLDRFVPLALARQVPKYTQEDVMGRRKTNKGRVADLMTEKSRQVPHELEKLNQIVRECQESGGGVRLRRKQMKAAVRVADLCRDIEALQTVYASMRGSEFQEES